MSRSTGDITTVLLDYDNTLVLLDETAFAQLYLQKVNQLYFPEVETSDFFSDMLAATRLMSKNQGPKSNSEVFADYFSPATGVSKEDVLRRFNSFYSSDHFTSVLDEISARLADGIAELFQFLEEQKVPVVIATNPLFPVIANERRLSWAGIYPHPAIKLITNSDEFHSCKPSLAYYQELLDKIGTRPGECLMVGNDPANDLPAGKLGIKTYLITDEGHKTSSMYKVTEERDDMKPDFTGRTLREFLEWLKARFNRM